MPAITLRQATKADLDFVFEVTEVAVKKHVIETWGCWNPEELRENIRLSFCPRTHQIISIGIAQVGILALDEYPTHVQLEKLYLLPQYRNIGIGTELLTGVFDLGRVACKPIRLQVLTVNADAQRLYARNGFKVIGSNQEQIFMEHNTDT